MGKSREIKKRMKAVGNIKRITRTMQMIATSKFARAQQASVASKPYTGSLFDLVAELSSAGELDHPLLSGGNADAPEVTLVLTSDRGLCGPYNGNIIRNSLRHVRDHVADGRLEIVGKKGLAAFKFAGIDIQTHHTQFGDKPNYAEVDKLATGYIDDFIAGKISAVRVIYMRYISAGRQVPEIMQLVPFVAPERDASESAGGSETIYEFSPDAGSLLNELLPAAVKAVLFQAFNDAIVSEHVARMIAMKAATDNAGKMRKNLQREFNRARQSQITTELTEIISGAAALE